jgi:hypothetical protein
VTIFAEWVDISRRCTITPSRHSRASCGQELPLPWTCIPELGGAFRRRWRRVRHAVHKGTHGSFVGSIMRSPLRGRASPVPHTHTETSAYSWRERAVHSVSLTRRHRLSYSVHVVQSRRWPVESFPAKGKRGCSFSCESPSGVIQAIVVMARYDIVMQRSCR